MIKTLVFIDCVIFIVVCLIFFGSWICNRNQVKQNQCMAEQNMYGKASFAKFKENFDKTSWVHKREWKWSLFYEDKKNYTGNTSEIHADIFMFNHIGMIMKTPIDYWKAIRYTHKYIKTHFPEDLNKKNIKTYKWE